MKWFMQFFYEGGWLFMSMVTIAALAMLVFFGIALGKRTDPKRAQFYLTITNDLGLLALMIGLLGQIIGLYQAMEYIAEMGEVSMQLLAGGIKVSSHTTLYGFFWFIITKLLIVGYRISPFSA
ncbi:MotA/TolQ/ExbB proton channel family protein [Persicobacter sp. CCB-QB2]|uniref:MotA/TolQ/ExbB proton channel family protein n=1 Tax=Persicobacter sp. CCB-QB2 TaxID=1561025 RepID=UPI0009E460C2|nr:MotA/TolQ/ExbB proton channel family protein [Persicobacter sp. CCB-QB2]